MKKYNLINNTLGWLCFVISAVTYLLTIEPTASFWDCPEFISQGAKLEVGHPPGNPIFMLTARFFVTLFGGDITNAAVAINSMSALLSAATILLLFWTITHLVKRIIVKDDAEEISLHKIITIMGAGLCGALCYTWSDTFWFSAVESEVYAFSSFCTALVLWLILKWENHSSQPHSDRYLVLIAYVIGVSIAVHLLNLLCIPAIVLVFYYNKYKNTDAMGSLIALAISFVLVALILYGLVPGFIKVAQGFELFFVNVCHMSYNMGVLIYAIVLLGVFITTIHQLYTRENTTAIRIGVLLVLALSGLLFITGNALIWSLLIIAAVAYIFFFCKEIPMRIFTVSVLSIFVIFIGYSSYALLLIRASANPPMNQNAPDNVFTLSSYLNREQYGKNPLIYGQTFAEEPLIQYYQTNDGQYIPYVYFDEYGTLQTRPADVTLRNSKGEAIENGEYKYAKVAKTDSTQRDQYVLESYTPDYKTSSDVNMLFTRMYSTDPDHIKGYKNWSGYEIQDVEDLKYKVPAQTMEEWANNGYVPLTSVSPLLPNLKAINTYDDGYQPSTLVWKPSVTDNLRYFVNYQLNHMYWRYFMWNFAGRQNDIQGNGEPHLGNWISGIPLIDNARLGDQSMLPDEYGKGNKGHNVFYMLPLLMGILGLIWQSLMHHKNNPKRGIEQFWVVFFLFFMTGIAIVLYLNQPPGQPRERDYAFAGSFYAFAIWIGMGVPALAYIFNAIIEAIKAKESQGLKVTSAIVASVLGLLVSLQMVSQTWDDHDRSNRYTTRDFGENYLNSLDENAIIFTNGDNDTFPLWYAQEVEGVRPDVRVVNLSYLATDWYANQMTHPYYDAAAVKTTAKPSDWAYDRLAYSLNSKERRGENALDALREFYAAPAIDYGKQKIKVMNSIDMVSPIDTAGVMKAFGLNPNSSDSITKIPLLSDIRMPGLNGGGFTLSRLLSFDIIANSVNDNFERPVYFASTVPTDYYLGLQPYLSMTGLAYQVTPFYADKYAPSPMADKAYENIVSRFRWGGLDDKEHNQNLYLDETVRRIVATVRNAMIETAEHLAATGDLPATDFAIEWAKSNSLPVPETRNDMARYLINLMEEKLPAYVTPLDASAELYTTELYLNLYNDTGNVADLDHAEALIDNALDRYAQLTRYGISLKPYELDNMGYTGSLARFHLPMFIGYKNYVKLLRAIAQNPEKYADYADDIPDLYSSELRMQIYPYLYLADVDSGTFKQLGNKGDFRYGAMLSELHDMAGIDRMEVTNALMEKHNMSVNDVLRLNPYITFDKK